MDVRRRHACTPMARVSAPATFPISIDTAVVAARAARAVGTHAGGAPARQPRRRRLVIGVDRLDYTKGLVRRFAAVERLLETRPRASPRRRSSCRSPRRPARTYPNTSRSAPSSTAVPGASTAASASPTCCRCATSTGISARRRCSDSIARAGWLGDAAARRHEPRRQGIRRQPGARRSRRSGAVALCRRGAGAGSRR